MELKEGNLKLDTETKRVFYGDREIVLSYQLYLLLKLFMNNKGRFLSLEFISNSVWGGYISESKTVYVHICRLKKALKFTGKEYIVCRMGFGWLFEEVK